MMNNDISGSSDVEIDPVNDVMVIPFSSGTTAVPKGVLLTHFNMTTNISQVMEIPPEARVIKTPSGAFQFAHLFLSLF